MELMCLTLRSVEELVFEKITICVNVKKKIIYLRKAMVKYTVLKLFLSDQMFFGFFGEFWIES